MDIRIRIEPADGVAVPAGLSISVDANYSKTTPIVEGQPNEPVPTTERILLDAQLRGSTVLENAASPQVQADVLSVDGSLIFSRSLQADNSSALMILTQAEVDRAAQIPQAVPTDIVPLVCARTVRLVPTNDTKLDFSRAYVGITPVRDRESLRTQSEILSRIVGDNFNALEVTGQNLASVTRLPWTLAHLAVDGTFSFSLPQQTAIGWLWLLVGDRLQVIGFAPDDLSKANDVSLTLALPALSAPPQLGDTDSKECGARPVPANVTETELADNPSVYSEDPGAFCKPFSNPERVLSEKSFRVIARVSQPEISAAGSSRTKLVKLLNLDLAEPVPARSGLTGFLANLFSPASASSRTLNFNTAAAVPARHVLPEGYTNLVNSLPSGRNLMDAKHPLQWEDDIAQYQAATVALGHILEFRMRWRSNGYSLGTVAKTLTLAPRQAKRIQKIEWQRTERARRSERTQLTDVENDVVTRERDYQDQVSAHLDEWARGASHSDNEAIAGGLGFFVPGILGGIGGGAGSSNSSSHQEGGRDTAANEHQRLRDAIRRHGDALRKFESTVVTEVAQEETVTGTSEVVRNLNYSHSLTVIYYQILRHLKIDTGFAGAREVLFVPFAIKAFDVHRAYRWREAIQQAIRSRRYLRALRYLKDVATNPPFSTSDIPPGTRASQPLTYLRGSIFVDLAIERPKDTAEGKYNDAAWLVLKRLLGVPATGIFSQLIALADAQRDQYFQANFAPTVAAKWANELRLHIGGNTLNIDSTLATRYQFNRGVRIDFTVSPEQLSGLRRTDAQNITVEAIRSLPPGSVANLTRMSLTYSTERYQRSVQGQTGVDDLVLPETGRSDQATVLFPLDYWERVDERLEITRCVQELIEHLNEHVEYYHKAIWWHMDRDRLMMMLDGFYVPNTNNVSLASVVDREPLGIIGNCLVYQVGAASYIGYGKVKTPADLYNLYAEKQPLRDPVLVSLPTDGLYAQTIMDDCIALEEHYGNLDWALSDKDPELGTIDPSLLVTRRADETTALTPTPLPATIINLQNAPEAPAPSGLQGVLNAVTTANAFRDMAGLAATQANALAALNTAAGLATNFGNQAAALELAKTAKSQEATKSADQKLATIDRAKQKGLTSAEEAEAQAKEVLRSMNPDTPKGQAPHENAAINSAITAAKEVSGSTIEANTGEGAVRVQLGAKEDSGRALIIEVSVTPELRCFGPVAGSAPNLTGKTKLSVRGKNLAAGAQLKWSIPNTEVGKYTITQSVNASGVSEVEISGIRPGLTNIDVEALNSGAAQNPSVKYPLSIPQFVTVDDSNAAIDQFFTDNQLFAIRDSIMDEAKAVIDALLLSEANVRLIFKSSGKTVPAHIPANLITKVTLANIDPGLDKNYGITNGGPSSPHNEVGDTFFDEVIDVFPGGYAVAAHSKDTNQAVLQTMQIIAGLTSSDPANEIWFIRIFGRLIGETMSHEIYHALLPVPFGHNMDATGTTEAATADIMDAGSFRSFRERTGIDAPALPSANFFDLLTDNTIAAIDRLTGINLKHVHDTFPVPPVPPFDK
jgi:hypothetical protein